VNVYRYLVKDSVEEKIQTLKDRKQKTFDALFVTGSSNIEDPAVDEVPAEGSRLSQADFEFLLGT